MTNPHLIASICEAIFQPENSDSRSGTRNAFRDRWIRVQIGVPGGHWLGAYFCFRRQTALPVAERERRSEIAAFKISPSYALT